MAWQEGMFNSFDGLSLFYRFKPPARPTRKVILLLHRGHEHSGRVTSFADKLQYQDCWFFCFDLRGHGRSAGTRGWAPDFQTWVKDLNSFAGYLKNRYDLDSRDIVVVANSVGSVMAASWILNYGPNLRGCVLGAPAFSIRLYLPLALPVLRIVRRLTPNAFVTSYVRSKLLTRSADEARAYDSDPMITRKIGVNVLVSLFDVADNVLLRAHDIETPVLMFTAESDYIVNNRYHERFFKALSSRIKRHVFLPGFRHALFHELEQEKVLAPTNRFIDEVFAPEALKNLPMVIPSARSHTVEEFTALQTRGAAPKRVYYALFRLLLERVGKLSKGISIGLEHGFDSGISLDYVYRNRSEGKGWLGRGIDRVYLSAVGWQGIRQRKQILRRALANTIGLMNHEQRKPVILDVASGAGSYLFEAVHQSDKPASLHLCDIDPKVIDQARRQAGKSNLQEVSFSQHDVFSGFAGEAFQARPNIVVVSGLFELYSDNHQVSRALVNLYSLMERNSFLIYTGQPWHPQLEMIGRLLNNRAGRRWTMRRRVQAEMDELIESAGFSKFTSECDDRGIFTVSCARKS